jgi:hypothetical protein
MGDALLFFGRRLLASLELAGGSAQLAADLVVPCRHPLYSLNSTGLLFQGCSIRAERKEIRTRAGKITLRQAVRQVLAKAASAMRVAEIVKMLPKTGYSPKSKNLSNMVAHVLRESGEFRRVRRGMYGPKKM